MAGRSEADICNMALGYAGVNDRIAALTDLSARAQACSTFYAEKRNQLLSKIRPNFAVVRKILTALGGVVYSSGQTFAKGDMAQYGQNVYRSLQNANTGNTPGKSLVWWQQVTRDGYAFVYQLPEDCLTPIEAWELPDTNGNSAVVFEPVPSLGTPRSPRNDQRVPYALENSDDGNDNRVLLSDLDSAVLRYVKEVTNPAVFPHLFVEALARDLAPALCATLRSDMEKARALEPVALRALGEAWALGNREQREDPEPVSEFEAAREG